MDNPNQSIHYPIPLPNLPAATLEGRLEEYSTEALHYHDVHQVLFFKKGISLLVDRRKKQPLFNRMTAFIPAGCHHRSTVLGRYVIYKSLYIDKSLVRTHPETIRIFHMSELGIALFNRIEMPLTSASPSHGCSELNDACLNLFLKVLDEDIRKRTALARLPVPGQAQNIPIVRHIENHFHEKVELKDFSGLTPYSLRHASRIFKEDLKISIFEYLKLYRILQASIALETTDATVTDISYACGYNSISCFFNDFQNIFSMTPKQFRLRGRSKSKEI